MQNSSEIMFSHGSYSDYLVQVEGLVETISLPITLSSVSREDYTRFIEYEDTKK